MTLRSKSFLLACSIATVFFSVCAGFISLRSSDENAAEIRLRQLMNQSFSVISESATSRLEGGLAMLEQLLLPEGIGLQTQKSAHKSVEIAAKSSGLDFVGVYSGQNVEKALFRRKRSEASVAHQQSLFSSNLATQIAQVSGAKSGVVFLGREPAYVMVREIKTSDQIYKVVAGFDLATLTHQLKSIYGFDVRLSGDTRLDDTQRTTSYLKTTIALPGLVAKSLMLTIEDKAFREDRFPYTLLTIALIGIGLGGLLWWVWKRAVFDRLHELIQQAHQINQKQNYAGRIKLEGEDELTELVGHYNSVLSTLEYSYNLMAKANLITTELIGKVQKSTELPAYGPEEQLDDDDLKLSLDMVSRLSEAVENKALEPYYQPVIDTNQDRIVDFELLSRWLDTDLGMVAPVDFIALAEKSGQMMALAEFGLRQACSDMNEWQRLTGESIGVSVNLSQSQFMHDDLIPLIQCIMEESAIKPNMLELEIKEATLARDIEHSAQIIINLRELGVKLCIDDFGVSKYSLMYLQRLPVNKIKLARTYVDRLENAPKEAAFIDGITRFASGLGVRVVAKGIENEKQLYALSTIHGLDCQGFVLGAPMPMETVLDWLTQRENKESDEE